MEATSRLPTVLETGNDSQSRSEVEKNVKYRFRLIRCLNTIFKFERKISSRPKISTTNRQELQEMIALFEGKFVDHDPAVFKT